MNGGGVSGDERVPVGQGASFVEQAVGAGVGHPVEVFGIFNGKYGAVGHEFVAVCIVGASAGGHVEQAAGDAGVMNIAGFFDFEFMDAAFCAPVAERFPLLLVHLFKRLSFPKF